MINRENFVDAIRLVVIDESIQSVESNLKSPPGRAPKKELIVMSKWFNELSDSDKSMLLKIVGEAVETSVFGFLCVLDGVRSFEDAGQVGSLELYYKKSGDTLFLNDPDQESLHELL